tara:strand:- start:968 stop:1552 length:585 start_codon:yes stop_codon:yes gene_type:complete
MTLANQITLFRIALIPVFVIVFYLPYSWSYPVSAVIFGLAAITDWIDGYVARKYNQSTAFGAFLDPVADKLMVVVALVLLTSVHPSVWFAVPAAVIVGREIVISALREWMAEMGARASVAVSYIGKVKTTAQMASIIVLLAFNPNTQPIFTLFGSSVFMMCGFALLYTAATLTLWSMVLYIKAALPTLLAEDSK